MAKQPTLSFTLKVDMMEDEGVQMESTNDATKGPQPLIKRQRRRAPPKPKELQWCVLMMTVIWKSQNGVIMSLKNL